VNIAYLMNSYPMTSTTFIRGEIEALEELGLDIQRHAIRHWAGKLVEPQDVAEQERTHYLLTGNIRGLVIAVMKELLVNPRGLYRSLGPWLELQRNSGGQLVRHIAYLMQAVYFRQRAKSKGIRHLHVHFATNATAVAMLSHLMGGPSYSFTAHGPDEFVDGQRLSFDLKIRHAAFVVAISNYCKGQLLRFSSMDHRHKIHIVRCGLAIEEFEPAQDYTADNQTLICVGRLCPQKGQVLIPKAVAALRSDFPHLKVILVGDGESRAAVEASIAEHDVGDMVELRGWTANREVLKMIRESRALLLPSFAEGLPIVIMEALALSRPVISTNVAGIPELVDDNCGWIVPAGSEDALIAAMRAALECTPAELAHKGAEGRARVEQHHDRRALAKALYQHFLSQFGDGSTQVQPGDRPAAL
jgi:colanic acid/amylovoran biosynthesis glycosyltransferase